MAHNDFYLHASANLRSLTVFIGSHYRTEKGVQMSTNSKPTTTTQTPTTPAPKTSDAKPKKKLTLDVTDVSEVLERKISPS